MSARHSSRWRLWSGRIERRPTPGWRSIRKGSSWSCPLSPAPGMSHRTPTHAPRQGSSSDPTAARLHPRVSVHFDALLVAPARNSHPFEEQGSAVCDRAGCREERRDQNVENEAKFRRTRQTGRRRGGERTVRDQRPEPAPVATQNRRNEPNVFRYVWSELEL